MTRFAWLTVGLGVLVTIFGGILYMLTRGQLGLILILSGMTIAMMGLAFRLIQWVMDRGKSHPTT